MGVPLRNKTDFFKPWTISLTGERAYWRKDLLPYLKEIKKKKYGVEIFLNSLYNKKEIKIVPLERLISPTKWEKRNSSQAFKEYILEIREIVQELGKRKGLLPEDYKILAKLTKVINFDDFREKVKEIKNRAIKEVLEKYLLKYLNLAKRKLKNFIS